MSKTSKASTCDRTDALSYHDVFASGNSCIFIRRKNDSIYSMEQTDRFWTGHTKTVVFISTQNDLCFGVYAKSNRLVVDTVDVWVTDCAQVIRNEFEEIGRKWQHLSFCVCYCSYKWERCFHGIRMSKIGNVNMYYNYYIERKKKWFPLWRAPMIKFRYNSSVKW